MAVNLTLVLNCTEAARALGVSSGTLASWRRRGEGPPYVKLGYHSIVYRPADLELWLASKRVNGPAEG